MNYSMRRPCAHCPFRNDIPGYLRGERAEEIADSLLCGDLFPCHETTVDDEDDEWLGERVITESSQHCAGALIWLSHQDSLMVGQLTRIAHRLGEFKPELLDLDAPVCTTYEEFIQRHEERNNHDRIG